MDYTTYRSDTGEIVQSGWGQPYADEGCGWVAGQYDGATHYIDTHGAACELPPRPGPWATFDRETGRWEDHRSNADHAAEIMAARAGASLTKLEFLAAAMMTGFLSPDEAAAAANGAIPAPFMPAVAQMPGYDQAMLRIVWPSCTRIERLEPFIIAIAQASGISDETLDALFGVTVDG